MKITLDSPLDMHLHLREGDLLSITVPCSSLHFSGGVVMPNLIDPVTSLDYLLNYRRAIEFYCQNTAFQPYMTLFFSAYPADVLRQAREHIVGIKLYPAGVTTQSENGVTDFDGIEPTLAVMEELGIPLLVHGETGGFVLDREKAFLATYRRFAETFPDLHIVMEHITTADSIDLLNRYENLSATVTLHHLMITLDDVIGGLMNPHLFCKPVAKTPRDRDALREAVLSGHPRIMFGSDSAPHPVDKKECSGCAAGIFSAPVALLLLTELFERADRLDVLQGFVSDIARTRYGLKPPMKQVTLHTKPFRVPERYGSVRPYYGGSEIGWSVAEIR
ncbi:MAG: dihydroorotase [Desulfofustis sp.]|nr:dihydroorotase [Desulfofustis sp.]